MLLRGARRGRRTFASAAPRPCPSREGFAPSQGGVAREQGIAPQGSKPRIASGLLAAVTDWDWTAIGTILLAVATFALAWQNRAIVTSSRDQLAETRKDVEAAQEQTEIARHALAAQTQPLLSNVPRDYSFEPEADPGWIVASFWEVRGGSVAVPFRNIGNAVAIVQSVMFWMHDGGAAGNADVVALPPDEITRARLELPPTSRWGPEVIDADRGDFSLVLAYADAAGQARGATRLDVYRTERKQWYVRQVHFGDDDESVRESPRASSAPST